MNEQKNTTNPIKPEKKVVNYSEKKPTTIHRDYSSERVTITGIAQIDESSCFVCFSDGSIECVNIPSGNPTSDRPRIFSTSIQFVYLDPNKNILIFGGSSGNGGSIRYLILPAKGKALNATEYFGNYSPELKKFVPQSILKLNENLYVIGGSNNFTNGIVTIWEVSWDAPKEKWRLLTFFGTHYCSADKLLLVNEKKQWFASADLEGNIHINNPKECIKEFKRAHFKSISSLIPLDREHFASVDCDGLIKFWEVSEEFICKNTFKFKLDHQGLNCLIRLNDNTFASGSGDGIIKFWKVSEGFLSWECINIFQPGFCVSELFSINEKLISVHNDVINCKNFFVIFTFPFVSPKKELTQDSDRSKNSQENYLSGNQHCSWNSKPPVSNVNDNNNNSINAGISGTGDPSNSKSNWTP